MLCRVYEEVGFGLCRAVEGEHIPTLMERERFCHSSGQGCPILAAFRTRGGPLDMLDYLNTWSLPPTDSPAKSKAAAS